MKSNPQNAFIRAVIGNAKKYTVINDGQVRYAIETGTLNAWERVNGSISRKTYDQFCDDTCYVGCSIVGTAGSKAQIELCEDLVDNGANIRNLS